MHVLDNIRSSNDWTIHLPMYHRGHLGIYPGTTVHLAPVIRAGSAEADSADRSGSPPLFPEIVGSTINPRAWSSVYRVSVSLYDAPGVLHHVLKSVARHGGSVLQLDSTSSDQELHHNVELMVDFASLHSSSTHSADCSNQIAGLLLADCYESLVQHSGEEFALRATPVGGLRRLDTALSALQISGAADPFEHVVVGERGQLTVSDTVRDILAANIDPGVGWKASPPFRYLVTSDTEDRLFRVTLFPAEQSAIWCSIRHHDSRGAIAAITDCLQSSGLTLLCALNRVQMHTGMNWFEAVVSKPGWRRGRAKKPKSSPRAEVRKILSNRKLKPYELAVFFDRGSARQKMLEAMPQRARRMELLQRQTSVESWLSERTSILSSVGTEPATEAKRGLGSREALMRQQRALGEGIRRVRKSVGRLQPRLFLSIEFDDINEQRIRVVEQSCQRLDVGFDVVKRSHGAEVIVDEVIERMKRATHILGVWRPSQKPEISDGRPSPWCLWELGAANALQKPFRILVEEGTNVVGYKAIHSSRFFRDFAQNKPQDFEDEVQEALRGLLSPTSSKDTAHLGSPL